MQPFYLPRMGAHMDLPLLKAKNEAQTNIAALYPTGLNPEAFRIHYQTVTADRLTAPYRGLTDTKITEKPQGGHVIQCKLATAFDQFAPTQPGKSETQIVQEYIQRLLLPESSLLTEISVKWANKEPGRKRFANPAARLAQRLTALQLDPTALSPAVKRLERDIIAYETSLENAFPDDFKEFENATVYAVSGITTAAVDTEIAGIFAANPAVPPPAAGNFNAYGYLVLPAHVTYTDFKRRFAAMPELLYVMNQIYFKWLSGGVLDRRSNLHQTLRADTPDDPGGIRCVHTDTNPGGRVAANLNFAGAQALPAGGPTAYHNHLTQTALYTTAAGVKIRNAAVINTNIRQSGKFAVEYSGIPFAGESKPNNNKIVFNYLTGEMLVTFDHYRVMVEVDMVN